MFCVSITGTVICCPRQTFWNLPVSFYFCHGITPFYLIFPLFVAITVFFVLPEKLLWIKEKWFVLKKTSSIGHKNAWCAIREIFMFPQGCFCVPRTCLIWDFVCLCIAWIIEPVLIVWGLFGAAILIPGRFIFSLGVEKHLSIALLRPLIITQFCIKQVRSFCHCCSMNNTINKWGLLAIFPQVFWVA